MNLFNLVEETLGYSKREAVSLVAMHGKTIQRLREDLCRYDTVGAMSSFCGVPLIELDDVTEGEAWVIRAVQL